MTPLAHLTGLPVEELAALLPMGGALWVAARSRASKIGRTGDARLFRSFRRAPG